SSASTPLSNSTHDRVPYDFVQLKAQADGQAICQDPFHKLPGLQTLPLFLRILVYRGKHHLMDALGKTIGTSKLAGKLVIPATGDHELDFVFREQLVEVTRIESFGFAGIRAFDVNNLDDFLG